LSFRSEGEEGAVTEMPPQAAPPASPSGSGEATRIVLIIAIAVVVVAALCACTVLGLTMIGMAPAM